MTRLVLIRHGEAHCSVTNLVGGPTGCTGLTEQGRRQAELLRERLLRTGELADVQAVETSVLPRAIETASILAPAIGDGSFEAVQDCGWCEFHVGEADGLTWDEREARFGAYDPEQPIAPGAESMRSFTARVAASLRDLIARRPDGTTVVVAHGGVIWSSMLAFGGFTFGEGVFFHPENCSLTVWELLEMEPSPRWYLRTYNDHAHLLG